MAAETRLKIRDNETVRRQITEEPQVLAFNSVSITAGVPNSLGPLDYGAGSGGTDYYVKATEDCYIRQGGPTVSGESTNWILAAGEELVITVTTAGTDDYIAALRVDVDGSLLVIPCLAPSRI